MLFSVLIANYNNGHFFKDCFRSLSQQTYANWEAIIVDDGSTDNSVELIKDIIEGDSRFKLYLNIENRGCGFTKNKCSNLANGEVLGFLDPDDALYPNAIAEMMQIHSKNPDAALVTSKLELVDLKMNFLRESWYGESIPEKKSYLTYGKGAFTHYATFKKYCFDRTDGIDKKMKRAVDQDLYYKMEEQGAHIFLDKVLYKYRIHKNSISNNENLFKAEYWHFYAKRKAYLRRRKNKLEIDNFTLLKFQQISSDYYLDRFRRIKFSNKTRNKFYLLSKSIWANPIHKFEVKIKSFILLLIGRI